MNATLAMQRAIEISRLGLGKTKGNPIVGAVIFNEEGLIAEGFHQSGPHAEVVAIQSALKQARDLSDAAIAISLEPCNHHGKTPPCTDAIIESGIKTVYFAVKDPNAIAAGGAAKLQTAGIEVTQGLLAKEAEQANRAWLTKIQKARPYFTWKIAATLDGKVAAADGSSKWITNSESRAYVAKMRAESDAILVGTGTVLADDPNLIPDGYDNRPLRVVVGQREIPANAKVKDTRAPFYQFQSHQLNQLGNELVAREVNSVLVEAGPTLGTALFKAGLIDELALFTAPKLLGSGRDFIESLDIATISQAQELTLIERREFGSDLFARYQVGA